MALFSFLGSSRESRKVPVLGALWRAGVGCVENGLWPPKYMSHNMGLCDMYGQGGGGGAAFTSGFGQGRWGKRLRKLQVLWRNAHPVMMKVSCKFRQVRSAI
jgi:hypothetical protein